MKIAFIGGRDIMMLGGIENYMYNLATQLKKYGHEPIVFCESSENKQEFINGFKVIYIKGFKSPLICKPYVGLIATLKSVFSIKGINIIHYNAWPPSLWSWIPRLFGIKSLMQGHGFEWQRSKYSPIKQKILKFMEMLTAHLNKNLIMCSDEQTRFFYDHYHKNAVTIPTAINLPDNNKNINSNILEKLNLMPKKYILFLARLVQDKNPDYLISAFNKINYGEFKLVIAGNNVADPDYVAYLKEIAKDNPSIIFAGAVYADDKEALLKNAYSFCIPSTIEGMSISLLEAMSYSLPIIASTIPANKEVIEDAVWVIPEDENSLINALNYTINNPIEIQQKVHDNYKMVYDNYTWDKVTSKYLKYLGEITK